MHAICNIWQLAQSIVGTFVFRYSGQNRIYFGGTGSPWNSLTSRISENFTLLVELGRGSLKSVESSSQDHELQFGQRHRLSLPSQTHIPLVFLWNKKPHVVSSAGFPCPLLSRDLLLHIIHVADLPPGQLRAAEDVPGEGTLAAPLARDDWEGETWQWKRARYWSVRHLAQGTWCFMTSGDFSKCLGSTKLRGLFVCPLTGDPGQFQ